MKNLFLVAAFLLVGTVAKAETFTCSFTEPFVYFTYATDTSKLVEHSAGTETALSYKNISFSIAGAGEFLLKDKSGKEIARLSLNNQGSDGMSSLVYPYAVTYGKLKKNANSGIGGCSSTLLPVTGHE